MRYCDYLHACVVLIASTALALIFISGGALWRDGGTFLVVFAATWLSVSVLIGLWLGRATSVQEPLRALLSRSRPEPIFPHIEPAQVLLSRLWP